MAILDQFGRPFDRGILREQQSARLGHLATEFAGHPSRGLTPAKLARILQAAEQGDLIRQAELFEDMEEKDAHILAEMSKRKRALLTVDWTIEPPPNASAAEKKLAEYAREVIGDIDNFEDVVVDLLDAIGKGYACAEIGWRLIGRDWMPEEIELRPQAWFQIHQERQNELRLRDHTPLGAELVPFGWVTHVHKAKSGYVARGGLHRVLSWPYLFKNYAVRDLAEFLEIYGLPLRLGTYPSGAGDQEKATLLQAVVGIGHNAAGIVPEGMAIEFKEAAKGNHDPFDAMIGWCERSVSKAILGGTLTSQADGKSSTNALGNVHNEVRHDLKQSDARQLAGTLTRDLVYPVLALNKGGVEDRRRMPRLAFDVHEPEDMKLYADALPKFVDMGMRIPASYAHEKLRIPQAAETDDVLQPIKRAEPPPAPRAAARAALRAEAGAEADAADAFAARLNAEARAAFEGLLAPIRSLVMAAASMDEIRKGLLDLYPDMDAAALAEVFGRALVAAELAGRYDIDRGQ